MGALREGGAECRSEASGHLLDSGPRNCGQSSPKARWGSPFGAGESGSTKLPVGWLVFDFVGRGEIARLPATQQKSLNAGDGSEMRKCTSLSFAAAIEWISRGPN